jgi:hypothetical protein
MPRILVSFIILVYRRFSRLHRSYLEMQLRDTADGIEVLISALTPENQAANVVSVGTRSRNTSNIFNKPSHRIQQSRESNAWIR